MGKYRSIVLAKLTAPPTLQMVREMLIKIQELPGSTVQIPFGNDGTEEYSLSGCATAETEGSVCHWTLYRGGGESPPSTIEWTYSGGNTDQVISYLATRFPGWSQQSKVAAPEVQAFKKQLRTAGVARSSQRSTLEGDLADMPVTNLLQSVAMNKMNGRLEIRDDGNEATVWFDQGVLADVDVPGATGDDALIELVCWETGEFYFFPEPKIEKYTVKKRLEILIMEGAIFHDLYKALTRLEFSFDSIICRKNETLQEAEFDQLVGGGIPVDLDLQKRLFCALNSKMAASELMQSLNATKIQIVPIIFNLLSLDVIALQTVASERDSASHGEGTVASDKNSLAPAVESPENVLDWRKVKKKTEILPSPENVQSQPMNFAQKIKEIAAPSRPAQPRPEITTKPQSIHGFIVGSLFQSFLLILAVILFGLYLQDFHIRQTKLHAKSLPSVSKPAGDRAHARKRVSN